MAEHIELFDQHDEIDDMLADGSEFAPWQPTYRLSFPPETQNANWGIKSDRGTNRSLQSTNDLIANAKAIKWVEPGDNLSDQEVLMLFTPSSLTRTTTGMICIRGTGSNTGTFMGAYIGQTDKIGIAFWDHTNPFDSITNLGAQGILAVADIHEYRWMRFQALGNDYKLRVWLYGDPEPVAWNIERTSALGASSGWTGIGAHGNIRCARMKIETDPVNWPVELINPYPTIDEGTFFDEYAIGDFPTSGMDVDFDQPHQQSLVKRDVIDTLLTPPVPAGGKDRAYRIQNNLVVARSYATRWIPDIAQFGSSNANGMGEGMKLFGLVRSDGEFGTENGIGVRFNGDSFGRENGASLHFLNANRLQYLAERNGIGDITENFSYSWTPTTWHWMRLEHIGKTIKGKVWPFVDSDPTGLLLEPAAYLFERTNRWSVDGRFVMSSWGTLVDHYWDRLDFETVGLPVPPPGPPPEIPEVPRGELGGPCPASVGDCVGAVVDPPAVCIEALVSPVFAKEVPGICPVPDIFFLRHDGTDTATTPQILNNLTIDDWPENPYVGATPRTFEVWMRIPALPPGNLGTPMIATGTDMDDQDYRVFVQGPTSNGDLVLAHWNNNSTIAAFWATRLNVWGHFAVTYDGANIERVYWNGVQEGGDFAVGLLNTFKAGTFSLASSPSYNNPGRRLEIDMFDFRIWATAKPQAEIAAFMGSFLVGNESALVANYKMQEGAGTPIDVTGKSIATLENTAGSLTWETEVDPR